MMTWDQKLSSGLLLTFMTTHLFQFRFAGTEQYWLFTLTFFRTGDIHAPLVLVCKVLNKPCVDLQTQRAWTA